MATLKINGEEYKYFATTQKALNALSGIVAELTSEHCDNYNYYDEDILEAIINECEDEAMIDSAKALLNNFEGAGWYNMNDFVPGYADCLYHIGDMNANLYGDDYEIVED